LANYETNRPYFGALMAVMEPHREGPFTLGRSDYTLDTNQWPNTLHGGVKFDTGCLAAQARQFNARATL